MRRVNARVAVDTITAEGRVRLYATDDAGTLLSDPVAELRPLLARRRGPRWLEDGWLATPWLQWAGGWAGWLSAPWLTAAWQSEPAHVLLAGRRYEEGLARVEAEVVDDLGAVSSRTAAQVYVNDCPPELRDAAVSVAGGTVTISIESDPTE